jgi:[ribosomal protein S5]-alanine N-acetyltransferase
VASPSVPLLDTVSAVDWRQALPLLCGPRVTLRELRPADAGSLCALLAVDEVSRFISRPPATVDGFERFIAWALRQRQTGAYVCFAVTLAGDDTAIGVFHFRETERGFQSAEWGFAVGAAFWGSGVFAEGADLALGFAFDRLGVHRVEARACAQNGRGNAALRKIGAVNEAVLRRSFLRGGEYLDQNLWTIVGDDWQVQKDWSRRGGIIVH